MVGVCTAWATMLCACLVVLGGLAAAPGIATLHAQRDAIQLHRQLSDPDRPIVVQGLLESHEPPKTKKKKIGSLSEAVLQFGSYNIVRKLLASLPEFIVHTADPPGAKGTTSHLPACKYASLEDVKFWTKLAGSDLRWRALWPESKCVEGPADHAILDKCENPARGKLWSWSGSFEGPGLINLPVHKKPLLRLPGTGPRDSIPRLHQWLRVSANGFTWDTHFDDMNNVFAMLMGRKRVWLTPPSALGEHFFTYPMFHPHTRQMSMSNQTATDESVTETIEVLLEAGDVLVVPEHWFHRTLSEGCSVMLTQWKAPTRTKQLIIETHDAFLKHFTQFVHEVFGRLLYPGNALLPEELELQLPSALKAFLVSLLSHMPAVVPLFTKTWQITSGFGIDRVPACDTFRGFADRALTEQSVKPVVSLFKKMPLYLQAREVMSNVEMAAQMLAEDGLIQYGAILDWINEVVRCVAQLVRAKGSKLDEL